MIAIGFRFPGGRYHATPWGRHVNEADVEWPPSPWRILRALIAIWHRKIDLQRYPEAVLERLIDRLAGTLPVYRLPAGVRAHSRHYMPQGNLESKSGREATALIFDAFVRLGAGAELVVAWTDVDLPEDERQLLVKLLDGMGYLGRAESWVDARLLDDWSGEANCWPLEACGDTGSDEPMEPARLIAPVEPGQYVRWREGLCREHGLQAKKLKKAQKELKATLPERFIDSLRLDTGAIQRAGWSSPPGARFVTYQRPYRALEKRVTRPTPARPRPAIAVRLALAGIEGTPLPRIEDALRIGEIVRMAAMKRAERVNGGHIPAVLSGHGLPADDCHGHAFYLPEDADADGHIDHVLVYAAQGLPPAAVRALDRLTRIWEGERGEWQVLLEGYGTLADVSGSVHVGRAREWLSISPYLHPWHCKKRFGVAEQIARECRARGLPEPTLSVERLPFSGPDNRQRRPVHFHRFRRRKGLIQPDRRGQFVRLQFPEPVEGPLALGFGCHYGLGMLRPVDESRHARG